MKTEKTKAKTSENGARRVAKVAGFPGLYTRKTATAVRYMLKFQTGGKTKYKTLDVNPKTATAAEIMAAVNEARQLIINPIKTFADYIADYAVARSLRPRSLQTLKQALRGFGLDDAENQKAAAALQTGGYSPTTVRTYMQGARAFFEWLRREGVAVANPIDGRKLPKAREREQIITAADAERLIAAIDAKGDSDDRLFVRLLRFTGARCSTAAAITPQNFEEAENGALYAHLFNVKCARPYRVQLLITDPKTCEMIRARLGHKAFWKTSEYNLRMRLYKRMRRLFGGGITPHSLRHLFASELLQKGVALDVISKLLDHCDVAITLKTYARHNQTQLDEAVRALSPSQADRGQS